MPDIVKIAAIVVTFNRKELLKNTVVALLNQTYKLDAIYIIDNASTDGTTEFLQPLIADKKEVHYVRQQENIGGAGGFYIGVKLAYDDGADAIWGMDDDAVPDPTALAVMMKDGAPLPQPCVFWSNIVMHDEHSNLVAHWRPFESAIQEEKGFTFVGFMVPRTIIQKIGFPRADLFILYDEVEYSNRVIKAGYKIYRFQDSKIYHPYINAVLHKKFLGIPIRIIKMAKWKWYYFIRNGLLIYHWRERKKYRMIVISSWILFKSLLVDRGNTSAILSGFWDGIIGKSGKKDF